MSFRFPYARHTVDDVLTFSVTRHNLAGHPFIPYGTLINLPVSLP